MTHRDELDGIRALAILSVVAFHSGASIFSGGWMGVDVFFALSGYLITSILLREREQTGAVSLRNFYARRVLRLYPALLVVLILGVIFYRDLGDHGTLAGYALTGAAAGLYIEDFAYGLFGHALGGLAHTWSLAVEEQFYLIWPPLLLALLRRGRNPIRWAVSISAISLASMVLLSFHPHKPEGYSLAAYFLPTSRFYELLAGCVLALLLDRQWSAPEWVKSNQVGWIALALIGVTMVSAKYLARDPNMAWQSPLATLSAVILILHLMSGRASVGRLLRSGLLVWIGRRSYGIYLIQQPVLDIVSNRWHAPRTWQFAVTALITLLLAMLSYRCVELPFLRVKRRYQAVPT